MGTPCAIGMKQADGSVRAIRCNYDGYVAGAGVILAGWYTEPMKIEALLALGDLSQLAEKLDACVAYHRDRHEPMRPARRFASVDEYQYLAEAEWEQTICTSTMTDAGWSMGCTTCRSGCGSRSRKIPKSCNTPLAFSTNQRFVIHTARGPDDKRSRKLLCRSESIPSADRDSEIVGFIFCRR